MFQPRKAYCTCDFTVTSVPKSHNLVYFYFNVSVPLTLLEKPWQHLTNVTNDTLSGDIYAMIECLEALLLAWLMWYVPGMMAIIALGTLLQEACSTLAPAVVA